MALTASERQRRYRETEGGRAAERRYNESDRARSTRREWEKRSLRNGAAISASRRASKRRWMTDRGSLLQGRVEQIKLDRGCADCGYNAHAEALDFDHVQGNKSANVASLVGRRAEWQRIEAEIAKCEVVCANCHRVRTADRRRTRMPAPQPSP